MEVTDTMKVSIVFHIIFNVFMFGYAMTIDNIYANVSGVRRHWQVHTQASVEKNNLSDNLAGCGFASEKITHKFYGREGSTRVFEREFTGLDDMTQAQIDKLDGIAKRLPAIAYDALFDPGSSD